MDVHTVCLSLHTEQEYYGTLSRLATARKQRLCVCPCPNPIFKLKNLMQDVKQLLIDMHSASIYTGRV